jgi:riboflavin biosynthesis pyrimidine reductase
MRKIVSGLFVSLDGVVEAPDQWHFPYFNDEMGAAVEAQAAEHAQARGLNDAGQGRVAELLPDPRNVAVQLAGLKEQPGKNISIIGSPTLVRSLLRDNVLDELRLLIHPIVVGRGKCLFQPQGFGKALTLVDSKTFRTGVLSLIYPRA